MDLDGEDVGGWLLSLQERDDLPAHVRAEVLRILELVNRNQIVSPRELDRLWRNVTPKGPCLRLEYDGGCGWLHRYGAVSEVQYTKEGERAICPFRDRFASGTPPCPGLLR